MSDSRSQSSNAAVKYEFEQCLQALDAYFVTLAKNDPKKLAERYQSYLDIHQKISSLKNKNTKAEEMEDKHESKLGQMKDFLFGKDDKGKSKSPVTPDQLLKISLTNLIKQCRDIAETYKGKGGRQTYSTILNRLADAIEAEIATPASTAVLLHAVDQDLMTKKIKKFTADMKALNKDIEENYIPVIDFEIKQQGNRFFDKKVDVELSKEKLSIATYLRDDIKSFINLSEKEKPKNIYSLISSVITDDLDHKAALQGTIGKEKRLGDLIESAKKIIKETFPAEYARGKENKLMTIPRI